MTEPTRPRLEATPLSPPTPYIQARLVQRLFQELGCEKESVSCFAEADHFHQVHFHVLAKPADLPGHLIGIQSFELIKPGDGLPAAEIQAFGEVLRRRLQDPAGDIAGVPEPEHSGMTRIIGCSERPGYNSGCPAGSERPSIALDLDLIRRTHK